MATRTRMTVEDRRNQLLDLGARLFADHPYDEVLIDTVAETAGVSRGLLYHYFPTKRDFFVELLRRESDRLLERTAPDPRLPLDEQLRQGVDRYLDHYRTHQDGVVAVVRGGASGDAEVQKVVRRGVVLQGRRIVAALCPATEPHPLLVVAVHGWLEFLRTVALDWLRRDDLAQEEVRDLVTGTLVGTLTALPESARPPGLIELSRPR